MGELITDEMLEEFAIVAEKESVAAAMKARFGGIIDRVLCTFSHTNDEERTKYLEELRAA